MCLKILFVIFVLREVRLAKSQESAQYLRSAMINLENRKYGVQSRRKLDNFPIKPAETIIPKDTSQNTVPMLSLTKGELAALYEAAVSKQQYETSNTDDLETDASFFKPIIHQLPDESQVASPHKMPEHGHSDDQNSDSSNGFYYYYYPIDSFIEGLTSAHDPVSPHLQHNVEKEKAHAQYHSHTHQHNVHITSAKETEKKKVMEPLFMAVSSFIGMAVMFVLSVLFLPKFGGLKSRGVKNSTPGSPEMTNLAQVVLKAIEGNDCSERLACEMGKVAKKFNVQDNRFFKLFRRITPANVGWYVDGMGKYAHENITCAAIQCRRRNMTKTKKPIRKKYQHSY